MRKLLLILLMCLFPLQVSWAAVANYCAHEPSQAAHHFAHHDDEHQPSFDTQGDDAPAEKSGGHHEHCHLSGYLGVLSAYKFELSPATMAVPPVDDPGYSSLLPAKPERPKWTGLA